MLKKFSTITAMMLLLLAFCSSMWINTTATTLSDDTSSNDMQFNLIVHPNGTIGIGGTLDVTHMYPPNTGPTMNASMEFSTTGTITSGFLYGNLALPEGDMATWPFNSVSANFTSKYDSNLLNATLDFAMLMPPEGETTYPFNASSFNLEALYANGLLNVDLEGETQIPSYTTMFPFNITDLTILANYMGNELKGNITFYLIPFIPGLDVVVHFNGNKTDLCLTGHVNVTYANYPYIGEIDSTSLEEMLYTINSTVPGPTGYVANMTWGLLECKRLNTTKTEWSDSGISGADVQYNATIHGNFTLFFARLLTAMIFGGSPGSLPQEEEFIYAVLDSAFSSVEDASLRLDYYCGSGIASVDLNLNCDVKALWSKAIEQVPPTVPSEYSEQVLAWLKIANATAYAIENFNLNAAYSSAGQRLDLNVRLLANATQLEKDITPILPEAVPLELREIFESYLGVTYCDLTYFKATFNYLNGKADFEANWTLEGDFKAQLNHVKRFYIDCLNATVHDTLPWWLYMLNETEIDINNFSADFKIGKDWEQITFNGLIIQPPKDEIDPVRFKLYKFLNMTSYDPKEPPREFEKLKITITSAFNGTHTVLLHAPGTVPTPDITALNYKTMVWENASISSLKDLEFRLAYQEVISYLGTHEVLIFTNSTMSNFNFAPDAKRISFNVTGTSGTGFCEITIPRALLYATISDWIVKVDGQTLTSEEYNVTENAEYVFISLNYTHSSHLIEIEGTWVITEFQLNLLPIMLIILSLIAVVITFKQRKRIITAKTKCQSTIKAFASKIRLLKT